MLGLALFMSTLAAAVDSAGGDPGCLRREGGKWHIVDADLSDCTYGEPPSARRREPRAAGGVFVADATGRILGRSAGLLGDRVMWLSGGRLFVAVSRRGPGFVLLYLDDDCEGDPHAELAQLDGATYANLAIPVRGRTGTLEAFVFEGRPAPIVPRSVWTGEACEKASVPVQASSTQSEERQAVRVRSIGPYPPYRPPFSLAER
jgi:hypothetical protein